MIALVIEEDSCFRECVDCGDEIPDPYLEDDDDEQEVICSTCYFRRAYRASGRQPKRTPPSKPPQKPEERQRKLFD